MAEMKKWGRGEYWGVGFDYDQEWVLTEEQKSLRNKLTEICRIKIRPNAIHSDKTYEFPRKSLNALSELGLLGLMVPKKLGGLGQSHVCAAMVVETIARYGCPSTAMVYTMHLAACATLLFRYHNSKKIQDLLSRLDKEKLVGTLSYSDPATGGHFWFPLSSKVKKLDANTLKILKYGSWATSSGHADWYTIQTISPEFTGDYSNLSCFLVYKDEVRAFTDEWSALGLHGNQSGPLIIEGKFPMDRLVGYIGDGWKSNDECVDPIFLLMAGATWNGVSMACIDVAKKHVTRKAHADVGIRICDYPTIQDYFGETVASTNVCRSHVFFVAQAMDSNTNNNDWSLHADQNFLPRCKYLHWLWIAKYASSKNVNDVADTMLHACGGTGYKTDLEIERLLRDGKAGWVMGPSNEVLRQFIGKSSLKGLDVVDYWEQKCNEPVLHHELSKLNLEKKRNLAHKLMAEVNLEDSGLTGAFGFQETDFENPFSTTAPTYNGKIMRTSDDVSHAPSLNPEKWEPLKLLARSDLSSNMSSFVFGLKTSTDHTGCLPGQYVQVRVNISGKIHERYVSPVSRPDDFGKLELILKFETQGVMSKFFKELNAGDTVEFLGPCGGFEYEPNKLDELTIFASGVGVTPGLQLIRSILLNPLDKSRVTLLYYSDSYDDILYRDELNNYAAKHSRLKLIHTLREVPEDWEGEEGFISTELIDKYVLKPNGMKHKIVMCGGPTMTTSCLYSLRSLGFPSDKIFIYGQFGVEQVRMVYGRTVKISGHRCDNII